MPPAFRLARWHRAVPDGVLRACAAVLLMVAASCHAGEQQGQPRPATDILQHLATFVEWPATAFSSETAPFVIGILGHDPFGPSLDELMAQAYVGRRVIVVRRLAAADDPVGCHLLFISEDGDVGLAGVCRRLRGRPVLTVGQGIAFVRAGGMIGLGHREPDKLMFLNQAPLRQAGLSASSKLLELAEVIDDVQGAP